MLLVILPKGSFVCVVVGVTRVICNGFSIFFWSVSWMGEVPLRVCFSHLFPV